MFPERLRTALRAGLAAEGFDSGAAVDPADSSTDSSTDSSAGIKVERPLRPEHGDYSSPVALRVHRPDGSTPRELAERLADRLRRTNGIAEVMIAGAGHLNVWLSADGLAETARELAAGRTYEGRLDHDITAELARLLRGADQLGVRTDQCDLDDLADPPQRQLICLLAETNDLLGRRPDRLPRRVEEIDAAWRRVEAVQPIVPMGDELPSARHGTGRLLAAATFATYATLAESGAL